MILLFLLCSCAKGGSDLKIEISPSDKSLIDLVSKIYDEPQLLEISKFNGSIDELNAQYPIECLRREGNCYRAAYLGDGCVAVLRFDNYGNKCWGAEIYNTQWLKSDFDGLEKGQLLAEVMNFDPDGDYIFLYTVEHGDYFLWSIALGQIIPGTMIEDISEQKDLIRVLVFKSFDKALAVKSASVNIGRYQKFH